MKNCAIRRIQGKRRGRAKVEQGRAALDTQRLTRPRECADCEQRRRRLSHRARSNTRGATPRSAQRVWRLTGSELRSFWAFRARTVARTIFAVLLIAKLCAASRERRAKIAGKTS